jgi:hypothetical protein
MPTQLKFTNDDISQVGDELRLDFSSQEKVEVLKATAKNCRERLNQRGSNDGYENNQVPPLELLGNYCGHPLATFTTYDVVPRGG